MNKRTLPNAAIAQLTRRIKRMTVFFMVLLVLSGITAFPIETELLWLTQFLDGGNALAKWVNQVYIGVRETNATFPFLSYGTDWLAFAHIVIAIAFWGPLRNPVRNKWIYEFGMIACVLILPIAFIAGSIRGIPFFWQLIDCSFGMIGLVPLYYCYRMTKRLESLMTQQNKVPVHSL